jgi:hypothetical protein
MSCTRSTQTQAALYLTMALRRSDHRGQARAATPIDVPATRLGSPWQPMPAVYSVLSHPRPGRELLQILFP